MSEFLVATDGGRSKGDWKISLPVCQSALGRGKEEQEATKFTGNLLKETLFHNTNGIGCWECLLLRPYLFTVLVPRCSSKFEEHLHITFDSAQPGPVTVFHFNSAVCWFPRVKTVYLVTLSYKDRQGFITFSLFSFLLLQGQFTEYLKSWEKSIYSPSHYLQCYSLTSPQNAVILESSQYWHSDSPMLYLQYSGNSRFGDRFLHYTL